MYRDGYTWEEKQEAIKLAEAHGYDEHYEMLQTVFKDGKLYKDFSLKEVRERIAQQR